MDNASNREASRPAFGGEMICSSPGATRRPPLARGVKERGFQPRTFRIKARCARRLARKDFAISKPAGKPIAWSTTVMRYCEYLDHAFVLTVA